jgi:hypothetical protein
MNASHLLEVATKVFVNQDQEAKWEADRKMKRKVDLLTVALDDQLGGHWQPRGPQKVPQTRGRGQVVEGKYQPAQGRSNP